MDTKNHNLLHQKLSTSAKNKSGKQWYKEQLDLLHNKSFGKSEIFGGQTSQRDIQVNYDLFNNIISNEDFAYICQPYGDEVGELPANFTNRDIISGKVKVILGMEMNRPFSWRLAAVNEEATSRKEREEFDRIKEFVVSYIKQPFEEQVNQQMQQQAQNASPEQMQQMQAQAQEQIEAMTPPEVKRYMSREHQDPAEVLGNQLLNYLIKKLDIKDLFNKGFFHLNVGRGEIYCVTQLNGEPHIFTVNPKHFDCGKSDMSDNIEDSEWATCEYYMTPSEIVSFFGDELTNRQIDRLYESTGTSNSEMFSSRNDEDFNHGLSIKVLHGVWKSLRKIGFLTFMDLEGETQQRIVDETYKLDEEVGDIAIDWEWIPYEEQGYKVCISDPIYLKLGPTTGQMSDLDDLHNCKLSYMGAYMDNQNSNPTCMVDRLKPYQYYYNIIMYRIERLMASDKGKLLLLNMNLIPRSQGIDLEKWHYYAEATQVGWVDPNEEGNRGSDVVNSTKVVDMSLASDIQQYINFAEYIKNTAGQSVGITPQVEGQIGTTEAVTNVRQNMIQSNHILEPIFNVHNKVKRNVLQRLVDVAKICYTENPKKALTYVLDDMSIQMLKVDSDLLDNSTYGIFVEDASKSALAKDTIQQLAHAAMQTQRIDLSDIVKVVRSNDVQEVEELLVASEKRKGEEQHKQQMEMQQKQAEEAEKQRQFELQRMQFDRETELMKIEANGANRKEEAAIKAMSFNQDKDVDRDGMPDILEVLKYGKDAEIKERKQKVDEEKVSLEKDKFKHQKKMDAINVRKTNKD